MCAKPGDEQKRNKLMESLKSCYEHKRTENHEPERKKLFRSIKNLLKSNFHPRDFLPTAERQEMAKSLRLLFPDNRIKENFSLASASFLGTT
jgi:hypothetical protein